MPLDRIRIHNIRNINEIEFEPCNGFNLIHGSNGSGKTTLLESIYLLGRGRSFRGTKTGSLISDGEESLDIFGKITQDGYRTLSIGIRKQGKVTEVKVDQKKLNKLSQLARLVPLQIMTPKSHEILERGPKFRRRFIEWGLFHVEHNYQKSHKRFSRALHQRNAALRSGSTMTKSWDREFIESSKKINGYRMDYFTKLKQIFNEEQINFFGNERVELKWRSGWKEGQTLYNTLTHMFESDKNIGFTQSGPQRADLQILIEGELVTKRSSRGEQKMIVAALQIAQARVTKRFSETSPILLIDDLPAELDDLNRIKLFERLENIKTQIFVTAIDKKIFYDLLDFKMFHVEHGKVTASST